MKKLLLAAAVTTLSLNAAQAAPTLYGKLNVSIDNVDNKSFDGNSDVTEINSNSSRFGIKGEEKLTEKLSAIYLAEWAIATDGSGSDTDLSARNRFIGLKSDGIGSLKVGKFDSYFKTAAGNNQDIFNDHTILDITNMMYGEERSNNVLGFESDPKLLAGLSFNVMFQQGESTTDPAKGATGNDDTRNNFGDAVSASVNYDNKDLGLALAVAGNSGIQGKYNAYSLKDIYSDAYRVTGSYDFGTIGLKGLVLGGLWQHAEPTDDLTAYNTGKTDATTGNAITANYKGLEEDSWIAAVTYKIGNTPFAVKGQYQSAKTARDGYDDRTIDQYGIGLDYKINKQARFYGIVAQQKRDWLNDDDKRTVIGTGMEYNF
ncbi:porin [Acinetobacter kanungonis]|uniref:porin n=1 Tax=Acinetobacter kanungonis TaxID=2699469 RepID=UPI00137A9B9B|nr:porin [Acinetobacter kanungonis]NCI79299.1 porin [Acinetobacter kanungonis]